MFGSYTLMMSLMPYRRTNATIQIISLIFFLLRRKKNIFRCRGRLENAEVTVGARLPVLLPKGDKFTQLLIDRMHRYLLHAGPSQTLSLIRQKYWIPQSRSAVRAAVLKCSV